MFKFAILIGVYSYLIFTLGLLGLLYKNNIFFITVFFLILVFPWKKRERLLTSIFKNMQSLRFVITNKFNFLFFSLIIIQALVNLIGVLGPELSFDSLWYHLTLPKIYLENHRIFYISGGLFYYSVMPKLTEMIYIAALAFQDEILAKFLHFIFGILSIIVLYKLSRKFFSTRISLITCLIFYTNLVVGWESITAYVDLTRTFFEILALLAFIYWIQKNQIKWLIISAIMLGFAISVKLLAVTSLFIFLILIITVLFIRKTRLRFFLFSLFLFTFFSLLIPLPWFILSFINTGNPIYPFFTNLYQVGLNTNFINPFSLVKSFWALFMQSTDPISPLYIIFLPLLIYWIRKFTFELKIILLYTSIAFVFWYITPRTGGGRFILPYLPALSIIVGGIISGAVKIRRLKQVCFVLIILISISSIFYRGIANYKFMPVIFAKETKTQFLTDHLNFNYGDFYDTDHYFDKQIKQTDKVLLYGFHNLYYVNFPFTDSSYIKKGEKFNYIAIQNQNIPKRFDNWSIIYFNPKTHVKLYLLKGERWQ